MPDLPVFTLYGLMGCPYCEVAEKFLRVRNIPFIVMHADGDPIIDAGIKAFTGLPKAEYPILIARGMGKNNKTRIVRGFRREIYEELVNLLYARADASVSSVFSTGQQAVAQVQAASDVEVDGTESEDSDSSVDEASIEVDAPNPTTKNGKEPKSVGKSTRPIR